MIVGSRGALIGSQPLGVAAGADGYATAMLESGVAGRLIGGQITVDQGSCVVDVLVGGQITPAASVTVPASTTLGVRRVPLIFDGPDLAPGPIALRVSAANGPVGVGLADGGWHYRPQGVAAAGQLHALLLLDAEPIRDAPDEVLAQRQIDRAARSLATPATQTRVSAECGWHGALLDDRAPAVALAAEDGPLADLIGGRIRLRSLADPSRSIVVLLADAGDIVEDVSLSRRAFMELAPLWTETLDVDVELLS